MADIYKILLRRDTVANWENPNNQKVLGEGEPAVGLNETGKVIGLKIGDGEHTWNQLEYITGDFSTLIDRLDILDNEFAELNIEINGNPDDEEDTGLVGLVDAINSIVNDETVGNSALNTRLETAEGVVGNNTIRIINLENNKENAINKVTELNNQSTNTQYPSAKCVFDLLEAEAHARDTADTNLTNDINGLETNVEALNLRIPAAPTQSGEYRLVALSTTQGTQYKWEAQPSIITFTVGETACLAQNEMRWEEYIQSIYNNGFILHEDDNRVWNGFGDVIEYNNTPVNKTDTIIANGIYTLARPQEELL